MAGNYGGNWVNATNTAEKNTSQNIEGIPFEANMHAKQSFTLNVTYRLFCPDWFSLHFMFFELLLSERIIVPSPKSMFYPRNKCKKS